MTHVNLCSFPQSVYRPSFVEFAPSCPHLSRALPQLPKAPTTNPAYQRSLQPNFTRRQCVHPPLTHHRRKVKLATHFKRNALDTVELIDFVGFDLRSHAPLELEKNPFVRSILKEFGIVRWFGSPHDFDDLRGRRDSTMTRTRLISRPHSSMFTCSPSSATRQ